MGASWVRWKAAAQRAGATLLVWLLFGCAAPAAFHYEGQDKVTLATNLGQSMPIRITQVGSAVFSYPRIAGPDVLTVAPGRTFIKLHTWTSWTIYAMPFPVSGSVCLKLDANPGDRVEFISDTTRDGFRVTVHRVSDGKRSLIAAPVIPYSRQQDTEPCPPQIPTST